MDNGDGLKMTIGISTTVMGGVALAAVGLYFQVQGQAEDLDKHIEATQRIPARVIVLEQKINNIEKTVSRNEDKLDRIDDKQDELLEAIKDP